VQLRWLEGAAIEREHWEFFTAAIAYLRGASLDALPQPRFYLRIGAALPEHIVMVLAERDGKRSPRRYSSETPIISTAATGGAVEHVPLLALRVLLYQAIEYAIAEK